MAKFDSAENELEDISIKSFPTVKLFVKNTKQVGKLQTFFDFISDLFHNKCHFYSKVVEYDGVRTLEAFVTFIESDGKVNTLTDL